MKAFQTAFQKGLHLPFKGYEKEKSHSFLLLFMFFWAVPLQNPLDNSKNKDNQRWEGEALANNKKRKPFFVFFRLLFARGVATTPWRVVFLERGVRPDKSNFGPSWANFPHLGAISAPFFLASLGPSWAIRGHLEPSWGHLWTKSFLETPVLKSFPVTAVLAHFGVYPES